MLAVVALSYEEEAEITQEERRKDLIDHRDDSTFSFDPSSLSIKQLSKTAKKFDSKKNVLMASYSRKKTRRRKKGKECSKGANTKVNTNNSNSDELDDNKSDNNRSATPTPNPSPRHSSTIRPQALALQKNNRGLLQQAQLNQLQQQSITAGDNVEENNENEKSNTLHPLRGQLLSSRQASSNRDSSLDDSGVVDDHEDNQEVEVEHPSNMEVSDSLRLPLSDDLVTGAACCR